MPDIIEPRVLKGFRDYLPGAEIERQGLIDKLEKVFRSFGFVPIDTPVLEYAEILLGKGGGETDKQVYRFKDQGGRDVAMRFDLTVPFARFMAEHVDELYLPFRRYHVAKVWRGENTQRGRYREFMQCDFDIVGTNAPEADADIVLVMLSALRALDIGGYSLRINHRGLFNRFMDAIGAADKAPAILRAVDKLDKVGKDEVSKLIEAEIGPEGATKVLEYIVAGPDFESTLARLESMAGGPGEDSGRLREIHKAAMEAGAIGQGQPGRLVLDPSITRGLDYYTGVVFEPYLDDLPDIGAVGGGGRYDELASLYTKRKLPGVGAAIGLDRLLTALETLGLTSGQASCTDIVILAMEEGWGPRYQGLAAQLRSAGLSVEVFPEKKKLAQQFAYAEKKGVRFALILGGDEAAKGIMTLRELAARENHDFPSIEAVAGQVKACLARREGDAPSR